MRKSFQVAALASALALLMSSAALAAGKNDLTFGGWSVSDGTITTGAGSVCEVNFTCSVVAEGAGFKQLQVTSKAGAVPADEAGVSYIMTIVTDQNATGDAGTAALGFEDVSFVQMKISTGGTPAPNVNGIFSKQKISENVGTTEFISESAISSGWAENISTVTNPVAISQTLRDLGPASGTLGAGDDFKSTFYYASRNDSAGVRDGFAMSIDQSAGLATAASGSTSDVQVFAFRERQGTMLTTAGPVEYNGGTVNWAAGEDIKAAWIGQQIALGSGTGSLGGDFGYLSFQNVAPTTGEPSVTSGFGFTTLDSTSASVWDEAFVIPGPSTSTSGLDAPCITDPTGKTC